MSVRDEKIAVLLDRILKIEKEFLNEKYLSEKEKLREIKKLIEEEVNVDDN